mmetsp:Transcript_26242/g.76183  ORF Transcript_26242/g.76183 Transcript_26242/m.76183 type:complete len:315 (-) Transcript_26242:282-1226(-)
MWILRRTSRRVLPRAPPSRGAATTPGRRPGGSCALPPYQPLLRRSRLRRHRPRCNRPRHLARSAQTAQRRSARRAASWSACFAVARGVAEPPATRSPPPPPRRSPRRSPTPTSRRSRRQSPRPRQRGATRASPRTTTARRPEAPPSPAGRSALRPRQPSVSTSAQSLFMSAPTGPRTGARTRPARTSCTLQARVGTHAPASSSASAASKGTPSTATRSALSHRHHRPPVRRPALRRHQHCHPLLRPRPRRPRRLRAHPPPKQPSRRATWSPSAAAAARALVWLRSSPSAVVASIAMQLASPCAAPPPAKATSPS